MKKFICMLLALITLLFMLAACGEAGGEGTDTTAQVGTSEATTDMYADDLPDNLDFGGTEIRFIYSEAQNGKFSERSLGVDDPQSDAVDAAVYSRNQAISERLGLEIVKVGSTGYNDFTATVSTALQAGDDVYDVLMGYQYFDIALALQGYLYDMSSVGDGEAEYLDIEKEYWSTDYINALNIADRTFWVTGDISLRYTSGIYCTFVNKKIYTDSVSGTYGNIFDIVKEGKWDFAELALMCQSAFVDKNSDSLCGEGDQIGLVAEKGNSSTKTALAVGAGAVWSEREADGTVKLTFNSENERLITVIQGLNDIYSNTSYVYTPVNSDDDNTMTIFAAGDALFTMSKLYNAENYLRNMEDDYYVIPIPKLNGEQEGYRTLLHDGVNLFGIAYTSPNKAAAEALLEAMASESYKTVVPVYYDSALKFKYTNDVQSAYMIDEIRAGIYIDFVLAWDKQVTSNWLRGSISATPTSALKRFESSWQTKLDEVVDKLESID